MQILEYALLAVLMLAALFIIAAVIFQKSSDEGLSSTIAGGNETFYGKEKGANSDKLLFKWTVIVAIVFAVAVLLVYIIQPDYASDIGVNGWKDMSSYGELFGDHGHSH